MIVFCEDCGEKNHITPNELKRGRAVFTCTFCDYHNNYLLDANVQSPLGKVGGYMKEILSFPDIVGTFVYHIKDGVLKSTMPDLLRKDDLNSIGEFLSQSLSVCHSQFEDTELMTLYIPRRNMVIIFIDQDIVLVVVCETLKTTQQIEQSLPAFFKAKKETD